MHSSIKYIFGIGLLAGTLKLGTAYIFSDKIGYIKNNICKDLSDSLGKKEILCDKETHDIIRLVSGKISQQDFDSLLSKHGYISTTIAIEKLIKPDDALYNTILEIQTMYSNPKISFSGFMQNIQKDQPSRPRYNIFTNTIHLHQLNADILAFKNIHDDKKFWAERMMGLQSFAQNTWQRHLLNNWITEMTHSQQLKEQGLIKIAIDGTVDYLRSGCDYEKTYYIPGTLEYEAHSVQQIQIIKIFIDLYTQYADLSNPDHVFMLAKLHRGFFTTHHDGYLIPYKDEEQSVYYLNMLESMHHQFSSYLMGRYYQEMYEKEYQYDLQGYDCLDDTLLVHIGNQELTRVELFEKIILYYEKSYKQGSVSSGLDIISLITVHRSGEYDDIIIRLGEDIIKKYKDQIEPRVIGELYRNLGMLYLRMGKEKKGKRYQELADKIFSLL